MPPKKKKENKALKLIILIVILVAVALVMVFFTLPSLGINLFGSKPKPAPAATPVRATTTVTTNPYTGAPVSVQISVDAALVRQSVNELSQPEKKTQFDAEIVTPYVFRLDNPEEVRRLLSSQNTGVATFPEIVYLNCFTDRSGEKTGWVRSRSRANEIIEIKVNSPLPGYPDTQIIDINDIGVLIYRYPDVNKKPEEQNPQLYRILSQTYRDFQL